MNQSERIEQKQLQGLVFAAFLTDSFIQPFGQRSSVLPARVAILSSGLQLAVLALIVWIYMRAAAKRGPGRAASVVLCGALAVSIALEMIQGERFYSYVMDQQLPVALFLALVFVAAWYGAYSGLGALGRTARVILALTTVSVILLAASVAPQLRFSHLQTPPAELREIGRAAAAQFYLPPELVLLPLLADRKACAKGGGRVIGSIFAVNCLLCVLGELTLGPAYTQQTQPVFTIARLGGLSVFRRMDALHVGVWLLLFLIKVALYFAGFIRLWKHSFPPKNEHVPFWAALVLVVGVFFAAWNRNETWAFWVQQGLLATAVLLIFATGRRRKKA
ncbi:GerAB/ArcD/ProY family transporter [Allofournierella sp.]|uniref:GerAB/ArcD/ProY family transporter n=1 Tax=Allofournierella sp. TaxID=1940256 RepID=UPI003AB1896C